MAVGGARRRSSCYKLEPGASLPLDEALEGAVSNLPVCVAQWLCGKIPGGRVLSSLHVSTVIMLYRAISWGPL